MDETWIDVAAPRAAVWDLVADFSNMGRWSPELRRIVWLGGAKAPSVGARFVGLNRHGLVAWATVARVTKCDPHRQIEWEVSTSGTRWGYRFEDGPEGATRVTEYREAFREAPAIVKAVQRSGVIGRNRDDILRQGMRTTLERVKAAAEAG